MRFSLFAVAVTALALAVAPQCATAQYCAPGSTPSECQTISDTGSDGCHWSPASSECAQGTCENGVTLGYYTLAQCQSGAVSGCVGDGTTCTSIYDAVDCSTLSQSACYTNRATCHFNPYSGVCVNDSPATCEQFYLDTVGCGQNVSTCAINSVNSQCYLIPTAANFNTVCTDASISPETCLTANCYYADISPETNRCYQSISEFKSRFPTCMTWSNYGSNSGACSADYSCASIFPPMCNDIASSGGDTSEPNRVNYNTSYVVLNPSIASPSLLRFEATVQFPIGQFFKPSEPIYHVVIIGTGGTSDGFMVPDQCNTLLSNHPALGVGEPSATSYADKSGLLLDFVAATNAAQNLQFSALSPSLEYDAIIQTVGHSKYDGTTGILNTVTIPSSGVNFNLGFNLDWAATNCAGVVRTSPSNGVTDYTIPIAVRTRQGDSQARQSMNIYATVYSYGTIQIGATSRNTVKVVLGLVNDVEVGDVNIKKRTWSVDLTYRTTDPTHIIGVQSLADVAMAQNCFGTAILSVTPPSSSAVATKCTGLNPGNAYYCWTTRITFETLPQALDTTGLTLDVCNQANAYRATDMGSDIPYPPELNGRENFFMFPKSWATGTDGSSGTTPAGSDATGVVPDQVYVSIAQKAYATVTDVQGTIDKPVCGFLQVPTSTNIDDILVPSNQVGLNFVDLRNTAISQESLVTVVCYLNTTAQRTAYMLTLDVTAVGFKIVPLDSAGEVVEGDSIVWADISSLVTYTPRAIQGAHIALVNTKNGVDSFSITVGKLRLVMPATGYAFTLPEFVTFPNGAGTDFVDAGGVHSRRLLQVTNDDLQSGDGQAGILLPEGQYMIGNATYRFPWAVNQGSTLKSARVGISLLFVLSSSVVVLSAAFAYGCSKRSK